MPTWALQNETITQFTSMIRQVFPTTLVLPLLGTWPPPHTLPHDTHGAHDTTRMARHRTPHGTTRGTARNVSADSVVGNNDVYPDYHQPYGPSAWLDHLANLWSPWLGGTTPPPRLQAGLGSTHRSTHTTRVRVSCVSLCVSCAEEQRATFVTGGYYSIKVPAATSLRIIALNTVLYSLNFVPSNSTALGSPQSLFFFSFSFWLMRCGRRPVRLVHDQPAGRPQRPVRVAQEPTRPSQDQQRKGVCRACRVVSCRVVSCRVVSCRARVVRVRVRVRVVSCILMSCWGA